MFRQQKSNIIQDASHDTLFIHKWILKSNIVKANMIANKDSKRETR